MRVDVYDDIYNRCMRHYGFLMPQVVGWRPSGKQSIIINLSDGTSIEYHNQLNAIKNIRADDNNDDITEDEVRNIFSYRLVSKMADAGMSQLDLAKVSGISQISISNYIHKKTTPSIWAAVRLADALGCDARDLL